MANNYDYYRGVLDCGDGIKDDVWQFSRSICIYYSIHDPTGCNSCFSSTLVCPRNFSKQMNNKSIQILSHFVLILGVLLMVLPIWIAFASSTHDNVVVISEGMKWTLGDQMTRNYNEVLNQKGGFSQQITATKMFMNSFIMALASLPLRW